MNTIKDIIQFLFFYSFTIIAIVWEIKMLSKSKFNNFKKNVENHNINKDTLFFMLLYMLWTFIGLISSQWIIFLFIILLGLINNITGIGKYYYYNVLDSILTIAALLFMLINKYHLHIDLFRKLFT